jgi:hypothetical protein
MTNKPESSNYAAHLAVRVTSDGELIFSHTNVLEAIAVYSEREIAVLGIEVLTLIGERYRTDRLSSFSSQFDGGSWKDFVSSRNILAVEFVRGQTDEDSLFLLTTSSEEEYANLRVQ